MDRPRAADGGRLRHRSDSRGRAGLFVAWATSREEQRRPDAGSVGLENHASIPSDRRFLNALWVSLKWEVVPVAGTMLVAVTTTAAFTVLWHQRRT